MSTELTNIIQQLKANDVKIVGTVEDLSNVIVKVQLASKPDIITNKDCIIFFDTQNYNSNYLTDIILNYLKNYKDYSYKDYCNFMKFNNTNISAELELINQIKSKLRVQTPDTDFYYCQELNVYKHFFEDYIDLTDGFKPIMLTIKAKTYTKPKDIFIDVENLYPFSEKMIMKNIMLLSDYNQNTQFK